jgi:hypothetical protein
MLTLDGVQAGFLRSVEGGAAVADVVVEPGSDFFAKKRLGALRYEPFTLAFDLSLDQSVYEWIAQTWKGLYSRRDGSIVSVSHDGKAVSEREFFQALVSAVTVPAIDAASNEPAALTVELAPESARTQKTSGTAATLPGAKPKLWLPANFRLAIDGLDAKRVSKIDSFTVRSAAVEDTVGELRDVVRAPAKVEFPNLRITLAESGAQTWFDWHDDFVVKGNNDETREKGGSLTFLAPNLKDELGEIRFFNLGIFRLAPLPRPSGSDQVARLVADLYCERMELSVGP